MKLYYCPCCAHSRKVLLALYEKNIPFEGELINTRDPVSMKRLRSDQNPFGALPCLVDGEERVFEPSVIVEYLDQFGDLEPQLIPEDRELARKTRAFDRISELYLVEPAMWLRAKSRTLEKPEDEADVQKRRSMVETAMSLFDRELRGKNFLLNNRLSLGDLSLAGAMVDLPAVGVDLSPWTHAARWSRRMAARPSWRRMTTDSGPQGAALASA